MLQTAQLKNRVTNKQTNGVTSSLFELLVAAINWHLCFLYISAPIKAIEMVFISYWSCCVRGMSSYGRCHPTGHVVLRGMSSYGACRLTGHVVLRGM